ncbi:MAG: NUDIX domain-containing protein [Chloroflexi bacterium]|nr:NUDIX domain-containing protein [Chloroflexota bacterium]
MNLRRVDKVTAIVLREGTDGPEVLLFDHPGENARMITQFPAGTIEPCESPETAVVRELMEETGVEGRIVEFIGELEQEWQDQLWHRWLYIVEAVGDTKAAWPFHCDCGIPVICKWSPLDTATVHSIQMPWLEMGRSYYYGTG